MADHAAPLRAVLDQVMQDADMPRPVRITAADAHDATEIEAVLVRSGRALISLESYAATIDHIAKALRAALLEVITETGAPAFSTGSHTISTMETRRVHITDETLIPVTLMRQAAPKPDTETIGRLLRNGAEVPGCVLSNASPSLTIRSRKA